MLYEVITIKALRSIYQECGGLEAVFNQGYALGGVREALIHFRSVFLSFNPPDRTQKHVANVLKGSSAKRLNMFLRWMVRFDDRGVDFGLWKSIQASDLYLPLDLHVITSYSIHYTKLYESIFLPLL